VFQNVGEGNKLKGSSLTKEGNEKSQVHARGVEANNRPRLPLAADKEGTGDLAYTISPSIVLVEVVEIGDVLCE
jgi:hypothetical protein